MGFMSGRVIKARAELYPGGAPLSSLMTVSQEGISRPLYGSWLPHGALNPGPVLRRGEQCGWPVTSSRSGWCGLQVAAE